MMSTHLYDGHHASSRRDGLKECSVINTPRRKEVADLLQRAWVSRLCLCNCEHVTDGRQFLHQGDVGVARVVGKVGRLLLRLIQYVREDRVVFSGSAQGVWAVCGRLREMHLGRRGSVPNETRPQRLPGPATVLTVVVLAMHACWRALC